MGSFLFQNSGFHSVPFAGINHDAAGLRVGFRHIFNFLAVLGNYLDNGKTELLGKLKVTVIVCRHAHDGAGSVICQHIVGQPDGRLGAV